MIFDGCDVVDLAERFGTPLYVLSETEVRRRIGRIRSAWIDRYDDVEVLYAGKAFLTMAMCSLVASEGLGLDVVSPGELYTAVKAGFPMDRVLFHGNNKTEEDLRMALRSGVGRYVVDSRDELLLLAGLAQDEGLRASVLLRLAPGVTGKTHRYIQTAHTDCKFGVPIGGGELSLSVGWAMGHPSLDLRGFHFHVGSQLMENRACLQALEIVTDLMADLRRERGFLVQELNVGGGIGIPQTDDQVEVDLESYLGGIAERAFGLCDRKGLTRPRLLIEPGRWIVGPAGITLYRVGSVKVIPGVRTYVSVDGGMADNPRPSLYGARYQCVAADRMEDPADQTVTVAGRCCESGDILVEGAELPPLKRGDLLAVLNTGAYNFSMASAYNRLPRPAVVVTREGEPRLMVARQSLDDILRGEVSPEELWNDKNTSEQEGGLYR
ncbi:MAG: diaminopimelate decarboxylase [Dethiosulfovibrio peptidovorans]|nr:MAG: diaminopimelate decarboxylase [Dethiosulfovibrio peptidovorans]